MELTQTTLNDLLGRLDPAGGHAYLPGVPDPRELTRLLAHRYGAPRTLVLDGFTDPTADEFSGAGLLAPFEDRVVRMRAWAYGDRWVGTGSARDHTGVERTVLVVAPRHVPEPLAPGPEEGGNVDWVDRLIRITGWDGPPRRPDVDWAEVEERLGTALPGDYKRMVATFGNGAFDAYLSLVQEPWDLRENGLLMWAGTEHEDLYCWRPEGDDPDRWPVVVRSFDNSDTLFDGGTAQFVCHILVDPHHPYTMARYFDTHWFMTYDEEE